MPHSNGPDRIWPAWPDIKFPRNFLKLQFIVRIKMNQIESLADVINRSLGRVVRVAQLNSYAPLSGY